MIEQHSFPLSLPTLSLNSLVLYYLTFMLHLKPQFCQPPIAPQAPQEKWLPTAPSVCSILTTVCARTWIGEIQSTDSECGTPYLTSCHFHLKCSAVLVKGNAAVFLIYKHVHTA